MTIKTRTRRVPCHKRVLETRLINWTRTPMDKSTRTHTTHTTHAHTHTHAHAHTHTESHGCTGTEQQVHHCRNMRLMQRITKTTEQEQRSWIREHREGDALAQHWPRARDASKEKMTSTRMSNMHNAQHIKQLGTGEMT